MIVAFLIFAVIGIVVSCLTTMLAFREMRGRHRRAAWAVTRGGGEATTEQRQTHEKRGKAMLEHILGMIRGEQQAVPTPTPPHPPTVAAPVRIETSPDMDGLPENARPLIRSINALMVQIEKRTETDPMAMPITIEIAQMRDMHLPRLCRSYVEIPEEHRREIYARTGRSASFHLKESLAAMETRLRDIDKSLARQHISTFESNSEFVRTTYGDRGDPLG